MSEYSVILQSASFEAAFNDDGSFDGGCDGGAGGPNGSAGAEHQAKGCPPDVEESSAPPRHFSKIPAREVAATAGNGEKDSEEEEGKKSPKPGRSQRSQSSSSEEDGVGRMSPSRGRDQMRSQRVIGETSRKVTYQKQNGAHDCDSNMPARDLAMTRGSARDDRNMSSEEDKEPMTPSKRGRSRRSQKILERLRSAPRRRRASLPSDNRLCESPSWESDEKAKKQLKRGQKQSDEGKGKEVNGSQRAAKNLSFIVEKYAAMAASGDNGDSDLQDTSSDNDNDCNRKDARSTSCRRSPSQSWRRLKRKADQSKGDELRDTPSDEDDNSSGKDSLSKSPRRSPRQSRRPKHKANHELQDTSSDDDHDSNGRAAPSQSPPRSLRRSPRNPKRKANRSSRKILEQRRKNMFDGSYDRGDSGGEGSNSPGDAEDEEPPIAPLCKNCNGSMECRVSRAERSSGKKYYACKECPDGDFVWYSDAKEWKRRMPSGPRCECGQPSYPIISRGSGARLWVCPKTGRRRCAFELAIGEEGSQSEDLGESRCNIVEDEEFLCGAKTKQALQRLFNMEHDEVETLLWRDYRSEEPKGYYDSFRVERAWKVNQGKESVAKFNAFRESLGDVMTETDLRDGHKDAIDVLLGESTSLLEPLDTKSNEALLLHGTKPEVVHDILVQGLNPDMAQLGLFGSGTYFAEHPAKINQYVKVDTEYMGGKREKRHGKMCALHNKLYPTADLHPANVFYCLVSRVVLGEPDSTDRCINRPRNGGHCIIAEVDNGNSSRIFREFVIFERRAIKIEYVVAYTRAKRYCNCGSVVRERTYCDRDLEEQRTCISCPNTSKTPSGNWEGGCNMFSPLPRCFCKSKGDFVGAFPDVAKGFYRCKIGKCSFHQLIEQGVDLRELEDANSGPSDYASDDGFIEKDHLYEEMK